MKHHSKRKIARRFSTEVTSHYRASPRLICAGILAIGAVLIAIVLPGFRRWAVYRNETDAVALLYKLDVAQQKFASEACIDLDGDSRGEFGFLQELAGVANSRPPSGSVERKCAPMIEDVLGMSAFSNNGIATRNGYHFLVYLPSHTGVAIRETADLSSRILADSDYHELRYVIYAWPVRLRVTGVRAFVFFSYGETLATLNLGCQDYEGSSRMPAPDAAFAKSSLLNVRNLEGRSGSGESAHDGYVWSGL